MTEYETLAHEALEHIGRAQEAFDRARQARPAEATYAPLTGRIHCICRSLDEAAFTLAGISREAFLHRKERAT
jgi:hypothetical protein